MDLKETDIQKRSQAKVGQDHREANPGREWPSESAREVCLDPLKEREHATSVIALAITLVIATRANKDLPR